MGTPKQIFACLGPAACNCSVAILLAFKALGYIALTFKSPAVLQPMVYRRHSDIKLFTSLGVFASSWSGLCSKPSVSVFFLSPSLSNLT
jgi:hypothetical protein